VGRWKPAPFNIYVWRRTIDYEFALAEYAGLFAYLNHCALDEASKDPPRSG